jgi:hypothetical protein
MRAFSIREHTVKMTPCNSFKKESLGGGTRRWDEWRGGGNIERKLSERNTSLMGLEDRIN